MFVNIIISVSDYLETTSQINRLSANSQIHFSKYFGKIYGSLRPSVPETYIKQT